MNRRRVHKTHGLSFKLFLFDGIVSNLKMRIIYGFRTTEDDNMQAPKRSANYVFAHIKNVNIRERRAQ